MKIYKFKCKKGANCCKDKNLIVTLTHSDVLKFFYELNYNSVDEVNDIIAFFQIQLDDNDLLKRLMYPPFIIEGSYCILGLNKKNDGSCIFLKNNQCQIYNSRPEICQSFPFTYLKNGNKFQVQINSYAKNICDGLNKGSVVNIKELKELWKKIDENKIEYEKLITIWNQLVSKNILESKPKTFLNFILGNISVKI